MIAYFLGVEKERPAARVFGLGSPMSDDGRLHGRPGFLRSSFRQDEDRGRPGRAYRHRSAWHNLKILLNAIHARYGEREIDYLYDRVRRGVSAETIAEADKLLSRFQGTEVRRRLMWLAVIINSAPSNLWLGPSKENTSINTVAYHLNRWLSALDKNELEVEQFKLKVEGESLVVPRRARCRQRF